MTNEIDDEALVLGTRLSGETGLILFALTKNYGLVRGYVAGGASRRYKASLQIGQRISINHSSRVMEQFGQIRFEPIDGEAMIHCDPQSLLGLQSAAFMLQTYLPEYEPVNGIYEAFLTVNNFLDQIEIWPFLYVKLELGLLEALGYGLDLTKCAVTGSTIDLAYVSPRSGRAVSHVAGQACHDKLLALPAFLGANVVQNHNDELKQGFILVSKFMEKHLFGPMNRPSPMIRDELIRSLLGIDAI